jgi:hypothetical protein
MHEHQRTWDEAAWQRFQRMKDDSMVNDYMAVIDTRIDEIVLNWRMQDTVLDQVMRGSLHKGQSRDNFYVKMRASRIIAERMEHHHRDDDLQHMIESIRSSAFHIPAERHADISFGPFDANDDKYLAMVLDYAGPDYADEESGSTEWSEHFMRFGRCLLATDDRGFRTLIVCDTEDEAKARFERADYEYDKWMEAQDDE